MSAIAVWETMYSHKSVFETYGKFIRAVYLLGMPELCIVKEISDICSYLPLIYSNIFICPAKFTRPCPNLAIHPFVHRL